MNKKYVRIILLISAFALLMTGCWRKGGEDVGDNERIKNGENIETADKTTNEKEYKSADEKTIKVNSIESLFNAIHSGVTIILEPGCYNITDYMDKLESANKIEEWNVQHKNIELRYILDGYEPVIKNVDNLAISGSF